MNLTVGPLAPSVYWRRRAIVAGVLLLLVLILTYSCGGSSGSGAPNHRTGAAANTPTPDPTLSEYRPQPSSPSPSEAASATASSTTGTGSAAPGTAPASAGSDACTDAEIQLTPSVQRIVGGSFAYQLTIVIKNVSNRTCKRDIGSNPQELHILSSGQTVWSSDS